MFQELLSVSLNIMAKLFITQTSLSLLGLVATQDQITPFFAPKSGATYIVDLSVMIQMHAAVIKEKIVGGT